jgi:hypothetical protein
MELSFVLLDSFLDGLVVRGESLLILCCECDEVRGEGEIGDLSFLGEGERWSGSGLGREGFLLG